MHQSIVELPATAVQQSRLSHHAWAASKGRASHLNNDHIAWRLRGEVDELALTEALRTVWARHDALQMRYVQEPDGRWLLRAAPHAPPTIRTLSGYAPDSSGEVPPSLMEHLTDLVSHDLDLGAAPLVEGFLARVDDRDHVFVVRYPSPMMDHWAYDKFADELADTYSRLTGHPIPVPDDVGQFSTFASDEHEALVSGKWDDSVAFWQEQYRGGSPRPEVRLAGLGEPGAEQLDCGRLAGSLSDAAVTALREGVADQARDGITPYAYAAAGLVALLSQIEDSDEVGLLLSSANRTDWRYLDSIGLFATVLSLRFTQVRDRTYAELCVHVRDRIWEAMDHQQVSYHVLLREAEPENFGRPAPGPSVYLDLWTDPPAGTTTRPFGDLATEPLLLPPRHEPEHENVALVMHDAAVGSIRYYGSYSRRAISEPNVHRLVSSLDRLLALSRERPTATVGELAAAAWSGAERT